MQSVGDLAKFTFHDSEAGVVQAAASNGLGQVGRIKSHFNCLALDLLSLFRTDLSVALHLNFEWQEFFRNESLGGIRQHSLFAGKFDIHSFSPAAPRRSGATLYQDGPDNIALRGLLP